jgi:hypothetical protein
MASAIEPGTVSTEHVIIDMRKHRMHCQHCGNAETLHLPMPVYLLTALMDAYIKHHADCDEVCDKEYA